MEVVSAFLNNEHMFPKKAKTPEELEDEFNVNNPTAAEGISFHKPVQKQALTNG